MALRFIIGNSVKRNRDELLRDMINRCERDASEVFFFVPEQANLEAEQELTARQKGGCVMRIDIVSFRRLLHRLLNELGNRIPTVLDDIGKSLLLRRVLSEQSASLPRFGSKANKPGFVEEVKSLLSEFVRYEVTADVLEDVSGKTDDTLLKDKLRELSLVYRRFREKCGQTQITEDDIYNAMCPLVRESSRMRGSALYFDGYTGFTPTQYNLIGELMKVCADVTISVTIDPEECAEQGGRTECFRMSRETMQMMRKLAEESGHEVTETIVSGREEGRAPALSYLSEAIFRREKLPYSGACTDALRLAAAPDREAEVRYVTGEIAKLVRGVAEDGDTKERGGVRYRDIGIICGDVEGYSEVFRRSLSEAEIPFFLDRTTEIKDNCLVDYIRSLLAMVYTDMRADVCMRWLKNPINNYDPDSLNYLENYLIARGVRGLSMWKRGLAGDYYAKRVTKADESIALAAKIAEIIVPFAEVMGNSSTGVREKTETLYRFLTEQNVFAVTLAMSDKIAEEPVPWSLRRAAECHAIYKAVIELLDRLHTLLPEPSITLKDYIDILDAGFTEMRLGVIPPEPDCVMIGDCKRSRIPGVRYLYFVGMNDGLVPGSGHGSELLNGKERELLKNEFKIALADTEKEAVDGEEFNILHVLQKPSERLTLTWSESDGEGKKLSESYVIRRIQWLFPCVSVTSTVRRERTFFDRIAVDGGIEELLSRYAEAVRGCAADDSDSAALRTLRDWYCSDAPSASREDAAAKKRMTRLFREAESGVFRQPELSPEVAAALYPEDTEYSVTRLESFAQCPFRHFVQYGLTALERTKQEPTQLETGSLCHAVLEYAGQRAAEIGRGGRTPGVEEMAALLHEGADRARQMPEFECFMKDNRSRYLFDTVTDSLVAMAPALSTQLMQGRYRVDQTEKTFSEQLGDVCYCGKIDRIDRSSKDGAECFKILDYKSSGKTFRPSLALDGIDIQLPLYLRVAEQMLRREGSNAVPAAALYMPITVDYKDGEPLTPDQSVAVKQYSPNGVMLVENSFGLENSDRYLSRLDVNFESLEPGSGYASEVVSVSVQKNGTFGKGSVYEKKGLENLLDAVEAVAADEVSRIRAGEIVIHPYRNGRSASAMNSCRYCEYGGLCRRENGASLTYREPGDAAGASGDDADGYADDQTEEA